MVSVLFGMPIGTYAHVSPQTMNWLSNEVGLLRSSGVTANVFLMRDVPLERARDIIAETAIRDNWDYVFFIDSDVIPNPGITYQLLMYRAPAMCIPYPLKIGVLSVYFFDETTKMITPLDPAMLKQNMYSPIPLPTDACALGAVLIDTYVFKRLKPPWFRFSGEEVVQIRTLDKVRVEYNEDVYFFLRMKRELGVKPLYVPIPALHELITGMSLDPYDPTRTIIPMERMDFVPLLQQMKQQQQKE